MWRNSDRSAASPDKKHVLLVNKYYDPVVGGVETVVKQYAHILSSRYRVTVLVVEKSFQLRTCHETNDGIKIVRCSSFGSLMSMPISLSFFVHFLVLRKRSVIVHFHEPFPLASLLALIPRGKRKYIVTWHSDIIRQKLLGYIVRYFQQRLCFLSYVVTTTSPRLARYSRVLRALPSRVKVLPLSIQPADYDRCGRRPDDMPDIKDYALFVGRLSYYKGIDVLLEAHKRLKGEVPLLVVGEGELAPLVRARLSENDCRRLWFLNHHLSEDEKLYVLRSCRFLILPSTAMSEAFGIIQLEAMACSKPVINTSLQSGVPWVSIDSITGTTVAPNAPEELASAMLKLQRDGFLVARYGKAARARVEAEFTERKTSEDLLQIYEACECGLI